MNHLIKQSLSRGIRCINYKSNISAFSLSSQIQVSSKNNILVNSKNDRITLSEMNYTLSQKKIQKIKIQRDQQAKVAKEEKERTFAEVNKISIDNLTLQDALVNLKEKFEKFHMVAPKLLITLFKKVRTVEELREVLQFYKTLKINNERYFNPGFVQILYYAFKRTKSLQLFAEMIIDSKTFQIFPKPNVVTKTITYIIKEHQDHQLAINLLLNYQTKVEINSYANISTLICELLIKEKEPLSILYPFFQNLPRPLDIGKVAIKYILRDAMVRGTAKEALQSLSKHIIASQTEEPFDSHTQATIIAAKIIGCPVESRFDQSITSQMTKSPEIAPLIIEQIQKASQNSIPETNSKDKIKQSIQDYYTKNTPAELQSLLSSN
ncbi:hypothetical protein DLAC_02778 [Tieghemostelium lacteum]|uniref:Uncharacterized protein n=1 Tax=Tieghemostelium lacteum TaxID=361077 RepID=A0A152A3D4_TIELA|nr:hypothetical protein DLAC_02778 [Tieghemostelium lacteum]|eukprot:KYR00736.1 hypothetical protein DLAC_02778 [Tieghemostelium lacteum]